MSEALLEQAVQLHRAGRRDEAARLYSALLQQDPRHFYALYFLGFAYFESGEFERAAELMAQAVKINPRSPDAFYNLGCSYLQLQRHQQAVLCFDAALGLKPDYDAAWTNRGVALLSLRRQSDALASFDRAIQLNPRDPEAFSNRGTAWFELQRYDRAAEDYARVAELAPDFPHARGNLALARSYCCDWRFAERDRAEITAAIRAGRPAISPHASVLLLDSAEDQLLCARNWTSTHGPAAHAPPAPGAYDHSKIRVAYVSGDFHQHATAMLLVGVLEEHDRERFEISGVSFGADDSSALRRRVAAACDRFLDVQAASDHEIAQKLLDLQIDIAVDLKGFTQGSRPGIFARRAAPIQINYLGHPGTMGAEYIDYILADEIVIPPEMQRHYTEQVVYLPGSYQATDRHRLIPEERPTRAEAGLPEHAFVFCCFNNSCKITRENFHVWMRLLRSIEGSVLWLLAGNETAVQNLKGATEAAGVEADRLIFAPRTAPDSHLARHALADLFLDTLPCSAHTAASDALWAGLPLLTVAGTTFAGRVAASLLNALGVPELVTASLAEYEALALSLARKPQELAAIRAAVAERRRTSALFNTARFTRNLERAYLMMWERQRQKLDTRAFTVPAA